MITKNVNKDVTKLTWQIAFHKELRQTWHQNQINQNSKTIVGNVNIANTSWI